MTTLDEIAATLENLPAVLRTLLAPVDSAVLTTAPEPGEWSVHQVIGHLITTDGPAFRDRIASIIDGIDEIAPFDPEGPVATRDFDGEPLDALLDELAHERVVSCAYVRSLTWPDLDATAPLGRHGALTAGDFVHEWPFHDADHLQQILANLKLAHLPGMTPAMQGALTAE